MELYLPLSGRCLFKVILCQVKDAKSPVHCQHMQSSLPLLHPKISQSSIESPLVLKTQEANRSPIHCFGWSIVTIIWQTVLLWGLVHSTGWSRRMLIFDERIRAKRCSKTREKLCLRVRATSQTVAISPYQLIAKISLRMQRQSKKGMDSEKTFTIGHLWA